MKLMDARQLFTKLKAQLVLWIIEQGYEVMEGQDGLKHMQGSLHYVGVADDLLICKDDVWLKDTEQYRFAGEKWKSMHEMCRWGGDFKKADGNHFSLTWEGKA